MKMRNLFNMYMITHAHMHTCTDILKNACIYLNTYYIIIWEWTGLHDTGFPSVESRAKPNLANRYKCMPKLYNFNLINLMFLFK